MRLGFTLIELLVVISIIAILISLLMPAIGSMMAAGKSVRCVSQQRQMFQYLNEIVHDTGAYPYWNATADQNGWNWQVLPNVHRGWGTKACVQGKVMVCPAAQQGINIWGQPLRSLGVNSALMPWCRNQGTNVIDTVRFAPSQVSRPAEVVMTGDCGMRYPSLPRVSPYLFTPDPGNSGNPLNANLPLTDAQCTIRYWHDGKANILFLDGHAASIYLDSQLKQRNMYFNY